MKILVLSDTHGDIELIKKVQNNHPDIDITIHAGDSQLPSFLTSGMYIVKGNCDFEDYPNFINLTIEGKTIHVEHGHKIRITDSMFVKNNDFDIVIFGHTHVAKSQKFVNEKYFFNPGSLVRPRDSNKGSYIILNITKNDFSFEIHRINLD